MTGNGLTSNTREVFSKEAFDAARGLLAGGRYYSLAMRHGAGNTNSTNQVLPPMEITGLSEPVVALKPSIPAAEAKRQAAVPNSEMPPPAVAQVELPATCTEVRNLLLRLAAAASPVPAGKGRWQPGSSPEGLQSREFTKGAEPGSDPGRVDFGLAFGIGAARSSRQDDCATRLFGQASSGSTVNFGGIPNA